MDWHGSAYTSGTHALDAELGVVLCVTETVDGWWCWHASHDDTEWTPDLRWFPSRSEAEGAAMEWAATLGERHLGFLRRGPQRIAA